MKVTVYGASDDLIEVEGDISEEFNAYNEEISYLSFGDGTALSVEYDKHGMWRINLINAGSAIYSKIEGTDPDNDYSDKVTLDGDLKFVAFGRQIKRAKK